MSDLDIVGGAAVDVVPVIPNFHTKLKALVLPIADKVGEEAGRRMGDHISRNIVVAIPDAILRGGRAGVAAAGRQGDDAGGAFARSIRRKLEVAFKALPKADVRLGDSGFNADLARLRARMETLRNKTVGVDVSAVDAEREIVRISAELERLGATHTDVNVRADTATARAALAQIRAEIAAVDAKEVRVPVHVDTSQATSALMSLTLQIGAAMAIPLGPTLAAGLGAVVSMAAAAGAGIGALALAAIPAIKGVTDVIRLKSQAEDEAKNATDRSAAATSQAASKALQMASAQAQLATAHRSAASSIEAAERAVAQAHRAVADAAQRAMEQRRSAAEGVERAEQALTDANRAARLAELNLTLARAAAAQQLKDLNDQLTDGALDQREATLRVAQAQQDLNETLADPKATQLQRDAAQLTLDRAKRSQEEQKQSHAELIKSAKEQRAAGVAGSDAVKAATERVGDAQRQVREQTDALAKAHEAATKAARDGARSVADAQSKVADVVRASADAQVSAAESVASAQRGVDSARLSSVKTTATAITKTDEYNKALANMTPAARGLFNSIAGPSGITAAFKAWSLELQPDVLPIFTRSIDSAKNSLPGLTPLVLGAAAGIKTLQDEASAELKTPFWASFRDDLAESVQPAVEGFGRAFGNVIKGVAGVIDAFLPHMQGIADKSDSITGRFARWGTSLKGSPDFERFLQYVKDTSPGVAEFIGKVLRAALDVSKAVSPMATTVLGVVGPVFEAVSWLATNSPGLIQALWGIFFAQKAIALGMVAFSAAMTVYQSVMLLSTIATAGFGTVLAATGIGPIIRAIVIVVGLLIAGFMLAYNHSETFRKVVDGAWSGIKETVGFVWNSVLKPAFAGIWEGMKQIGSIASWLWNNILGPVFGFLYEGAKLLITGVIVAFLLPAYLAFKQLGNIGRWLWEKAIGPAFADIGAKATWLWEKILRPVFGWIGDKAKWLYDKAIKPVMQDSKKAFEDLGDAGKWLWDKVIKPVFGWIGDKAGWLYDEAIKPAFDQIKKAVKAVSDSFGDGKDAIKKAWDQVQDIARKPVRFIMEHVYNGGIVPLWNKVAAITGADKIKKLDLKGFHSGGIMDGYSPGRDDRIIAVGGGEAILRPEVTRALGHDPINTWNAAARSGGVGAVQRAIANGMPAYKDGGIIGYFKDKANSVGNFISGVGDFLDPSKAFDKAKSYISGQMKPLLTNPWARSVGKLPGTILTSLKDKALDLFGFGGGGGGGQWIKPVNAGYGTPFGKAGSMWSSGHHTGLDFPAAVGAAVKAVADGTVASASNGGPYGNHITINHGGGLTSLYAHLSKMLASSGDRVKQGQQIGAVGATGNVTGPHLHLEARVNGRAVDPMSYLSGGGGGGNGGSGVARWRNVVNQALKLTGNPSSYADLTLRRMNQESGGNPNAVNNWDSNAKNGTPSVGLMQLIKPTFEAYAGAMRSSMPKLHGVSTNPLANIYASMRYAKSAYGSLPSAYNKPGGYYEGGFPQLGETAWVGEKGPELLQFLTPTKVHSTRDSMAIQRAAQTIPAGSGGAAQAVPNITVKNYIDGREVSGFVDTRIEHYDAELARSIEVGRIL